MAWKKNFWRTELASGTTPVFSKYFLAFLAKEGNIFWLSEPLCIFLLNSYHQIPLEGFDHTTNASVALDHTSRARRTTLMYGWQFYVLW
jgi:hypothetical protein